MVKKFGLFLILLSGLLNGSMVFAQYRVTVPLQTFYAYDPAMPLHEKVEPLSLKTSSLKGYKITFDSVHDERVESVLYEPQGKGPFPCILFLHGYGMKRELPEAAQAYIAGRGYAFFAISLKYTNERKVEGKPLASKDVVRFRDAIVQTVMDFRRGIDLLSKRKEIDSKRLALFGLSMGSIEGSLLFSIDPRIRVAALGVGGADFPLLAMESVFMGPAFDLRTLGRTEQELLDIVAPVDAVNLASHSKGRPLLMVNGREDRIVPPAAARALYRAFAEPKHLIWFQGGHVPSFDVILDLVQGMLDWFARYLLPESLPRLNPLKNQVPRLLSFSIGGGGKGVSQGERAVLHARPEDPDGNLIFVKAILHGADTEVLLFDDGNRKNGDLKKGDGIYSARAVIPRTSQLGETQVEAYAVDYNGEVSKPLYASLDILPYRYPPGAPPKILSHTLPKKVAAGEKVTLEVTASDPDGDLERVVAKIEEFGLSVDLPKVPGEKGRYRYALEIPDLVPPGLYHIALRAYDRTGRASQKMEQEVLLEKK